MQLVYAAYKRCSCKVAGRVLHIIPKCTQPKICSMVHMYVHGCLLETMAMPWTFNRLCKLKHQQSNGLPHAFTFEISTALSLAVVATVRSLFAHCWNLACQGWVLNWWHARQLASSLLIAPPACVGPLTEWNPGWDHMDCPYLAPLEQPELAANTDNALDCATLYDSKFHVCRCHEVFTFR